MSSYGKEGGQFSALQMAPNFEIMLLITQATGAFVVTDSHHRWGELVNACHREAGIVVPRIQKITDHLAASLLPMCEDVQANIDMLEDGKMESHRQSFEALNKRLSDQVAIIDEDTVIASLEKAVASARKNLADKTSKGVSMKLKICAPSGGMYHNHVQRLMVRCGIEDRPDRVALALLMDFQEEQ